MAVLAASGLALVVALSSCSDGSPKAVQPTPTTTVVERSSSSTSSSSTTTVVSNPTTTSRPTTTSPALSPEATAQALYAAWSTADRVAAGKVAQPEAVAALFARPWQAGDGWAFSECSGAAGSLICRWRRPTGQQVLFRVQNVTGGQPVTVADVRFQP